MISKATEKDLGAIMKVVDQVIEVMHAQGSFQWDESYPLVSDYQKDLNRDELYVYEELGAILGACTISNRGHEEYHLINWSEHDLALTLKRLAVSPNARGKGVADQFIEFAEELAHKKNIPHLNTDTFAENLYAQQLFKRNEFRFVQARIEDEGSELYYFEKNVT
ncbi:N-acetyltransferase [Paraliobacillus quinghaiensis]|uniref:N-acetyltransferase n=1 Tax=Paraliobacillus quinghaiensis TaxID=470815 RepID=A0A917TR63_9BACI|nr:GNAT family N-acetyltransferase [Paraliobacillus quinghaiensis]GGM34240.1 N-acetyltransferase [Paraliobacillus quinghaiensis]